MCCIICKKLLLTRNMIDANTIFHACFRVPNNFSSVAAVEICPNSRCNNKYGVFDVSKYTEDRDSCSNKFSRSTKRRLARSRSWSNEFVESSLPTKHALRILGQSLAQLSSQINASLSLTNNEERKRFVLFLFEYVSVGTVVYGAHELLNLP